MIRREVIIPFQPARGMDVPDRQSYSGQAINGRGISDPERRHPVEASATTILRMTGPYDFVPGHGAYETVDLPPQWASTADGTPCKRLSPVRSACSEVVGGPPDIGKISDQKGMIDSRLAKTGARTIRHENTSWARKPPSGKAAAL